MYNINIWSKITPIDSFLQSTPLINLEKESPSFKDSTNETETAIKDALDAQKVANEKLQAFCKDYGTFHTSLKDADVILGLNDPFRNFFKTFWGF